MRRVQSLLREFLPDVIEALRVIAESGDGATVVHCHVGKGRTGWFCATLAMLLELSPDQVRHDHLLSGQGVEVEAIRYFQTVVAQAGGAAAMLNEAGFGEADRRPIATELLTRDVPR